MPANQTPQEKMNDFRNDGTEQTSGTGRYCVEVPQEKLDESMDSDYWRTMERNHYDRVPTFG